ncbi:MAG TPA: gamma-glutamyl-gamma-aminobutyrate hydrolase family protein, partial [Pyrinomonadaceae bacterium]|nr:gamma-glutamyl-gamma-aminobutyrate hydrolase family protein [Pyrinomonadaceae bacterium]
MIYLVDNTIDGQGLSPREIQETLARLCPDTPVVRERYTTVSLKRVEELGPTHIILSGQSHPWESYTEESLAGVFEVISRARQPILGICGGHQQIALCYGAQVAVMKRLEPGTTGYEGCLRERGFFDVETDGDTIFKGLPRRISVWHSHFDEVKELPEGFRRTASNETCQLQAMQHTERPLFSVQFHPELFDEAHSHGKQVLENFL